jgi:outer membrane receptor for Fe3+-dicitrate
LQQRIDEQFSVEAKEEWFHPLMADALGSLSTHHQQQSPQPRVSATRYFPEKGVLLHASYDRVFETPNFDNILISRLANVSSLNPGGKRMPLQPARGNFCEVGATKEFNQHLLAELNYAS